MRSVKNREKGQSLLAKPIVLVMIIALLAFLIFFMLQQQGGMEKQTSRLDLLSSTSDTLSLLTHSPRCLAYQPESGGAYGSIIPAEKLREFEIKYSGREPLCAHNFIYGWQAQVKDLSTDRTWEFGAQEFSKQGALKNSETRQMPIAIRYSPQRVNPGRIKLKMVNGELERIGGKLNYLCASGKASGRISFYNSHPITVKTDKICMTFSQNRSCRPLRCQVEMVEVKSTGEHLRQVTIKGRTEGVNGTSGISKTDRTAKEIILRESDLPSGSNLDLERKMNRFYMEVGSASVNLKDFKSAYGRTFQGTAFESIMSGVIVFPNYRNREVISDIIRESGSGIVAPRIGYNSIVTKEGKTYTVIFAKKNVLVGLVVKGAESKQQALGFAQIMANRI